MAENKTRRRRTSKSSSSRASSSAKSSQRSGGGSSKRAKSPAKRSTASGGSAKRTSANSDNNSNNHAQSPRDVVIHGVRQLQELVGRPVESITGIEKHGREWKLNVEVLELERIPNTTDVLGEYDVTVDHNGDLVGVHRTRRYPRAEARED